MADAADEAGEYEVGECLRFLWKHRLVPDKGPLEGLYWNWLSDHAEEFWDRMPYSSYATTASGSAALNRVVSAWPQHKHLLINALEKETPT